MKKRNLFSLGLILMVMITYFSGPRVPDPIYSTGLPELPAGLVAQEEYVQKNEEKKPIRRDNQARILWQHDPPQVTEYSLVYLHGFAGSYRDGYPVNVQIADTLQANSYLSRWAGHGLQPPASLECFSPEAAWESAKEALAIGKSIGKKVILMSTSTGGTLALKLAATYPGDVFALINLSPNIKDDIEAAFVLNSPWGYEIAQLVIGDDRKVKLQTEIESQYWDTLYPSSALVDLEVLVGTTMTEETFGQVTCPVLTLYYYENFLQEDEHVEVDIYPEVHRLLSTPDSVKHLVPLRPPKPILSGAGSDPKTQIQWSGRLSHFCGKRFKLALRNRNNGIFYSCTGSLPGDYQNLKNIFPKNILFSIISSYIPRGFFSTGIPVAP
jgi:pimeloyl-ACP methyl ester carboxylesterase